MSRFRHAIQDRDQHILTLRAACGVLVLLLLLSLSGWMMAPRALTIYTPPDVRSGSTRPWWPVPVSQVYAFGFYIFQQLNAWPKDGEVDYPAKIYGSAAGGPDPLRRAESVCTAAYSRSCSRHSPGIIGVVAPIDHIVSLCAGNSLPVRGLGCG